MGIVGLDKSVSLDGYITGPNPGPDSPLGDGGTRISDWMMADPADDGASGSRQLSDAYHELFDDVFTPGGAIVMGKRMFEMIDGPDGWVAPDGTPFTWPCFVLTHEVRETVTKGQTRFTFVNDGIESALAQARLAAGEDNIGIAGASVSRQFIRAGLLDEITIHLVPVFLGGGVRLFDDLGISPRDLEFAGGKQVAGVTHLRFRFAPAAGA
ncbi:MAG: dihydrofolate reductase family protein [Chloroflexia bacterium]|nr:dihydrofolate reductase family protein [Chloroflexia bacterium]